LKEESGFSIKFYFILFALFISVIGFIIKSESADKKTILIIILIAIIIFSLQERQTYSGIRNGTNSIIDKILSKKSLTRYKIKPQNWPSRILFAFQVGITVFLVLFIAGVVFWLSGVLSTIILLVIILTTRYTNY